MNMKQVDTDYTLERWLAIFLGLLFLLPWVAEAQQPDARNGGPLLVRLDDVGYGSLRALASPRAVALDHGKSSARATAPRTCLEAHARGSDGRATLGLGRHLAVARLDLPSEHPRLVVL